MRELRALPSTAASGSSSFLCDNRNLPDASTGTTGCAMLIATGGTTHRTRLAALLCDRRFCGHCDVAFQLRKDRQCSWAWR